jgi:hypothetical protein
MAVNASPDSVTPSTFDKSTRSNAKTAPLTAVVITIASAHTKATATRAILPRFFLLEFISILHPSTHLIVPTNKI